MITVTQRKAAFKAGSALQALSLLGAGIVGATAFAAPATAQDATSQEDGVQIADSQDVATGQGIVVTGSRIRQANLESSSPLQITTSEEIRETGLTRLEDVLNTLPQVEAAQTAFVSNGASGTATLDLRGLSPNRTLVLVNGRRLQPGSTNQSAAGYGADINQIPGALVQRIDVTTGGASSVYGADAVAGVVNFIMDDRFEGIRLDAGLGYYMHDNGDTFVTEKSLARGFSVPTDTAFDGRQFHVDLSLGADFADGRGHAVAYATYRKISSVFQGDRDHSVCALNGAGTACGGSYNAPVANFDLYAFQNNDPTTGTEDASGNQFLTLNPANGFVDASNNIYNYAPINYFQRPDERYTLGAFVNYDVSSAFNPYAEVMFMNNRSVAQIAESGTFFNDLYTIPCNSPLLTAAQQGDLCGGGPNALTYTDGAGNQVPIGPSDSFAAYIGKRNVEGGGRQDILEHNSFRMLGGTKGEVSPNWSYDASIQYGQSSLSDSYVNDFYGPNIFDALNVTTDGSGNVVCANPAPSNASCVPYPVFQRGAVTPAAASTLSATGTRTGVIKEFIANGFVTGNLGFGISADPIAVVFGGEYRNEIYKAVSDYVFENGLLLGQGGPTPSVSGQFDVWELFTEASVPLLQDMSFARDLRLELGYRYSNYAVQGGSSYDTHTYKAQLNWEVNSLLRIRGGYNRAVRAPNPVELFTPSSLGLWSGSDPCAGATPELTAAQCANAGVSAAQYGNVRASPASQYNGLFSGNLNLSPEKADTITAGFVVTPTNRISFSADYYRIKIKDVIGIYPQDQLIRDCATGTNSALCSRIVRSASGNLWLGQSGYVTSSQENLAGRDFQGVDVSAGYRMPIGEGSLDTSLSGTYLIKKEYQDGPTTTPYDCAGVFSSVCFPSPEWRHTLRVSYRSPESFTITGKWRFMSSIDGAAANGATSIPSYSWFDLAATADVSDNFSLTAGANNILDKNPPLVGGGVNPTNGNTFAGFYDTLGRYVFIEASLRF